MDKFDKVMQLAIIVLLTAVSMGALLVVPAVVLYALVAPLFGPDPAGHLLSVLKGAAWIGGALAVLCALLVGSGWLYQRSTVARAIFHGLAWAFVALIVLGALSQCMHGGSRCSPSRYIDCS